MLTARIVWREEPDRFDLGEIQPTEKKSLVLHL